MYYKTIKRLILLYLILFIHTNFNLYAAALSLNDIINEALTNNTDLQTNKKNIDAAQSDVISTGLRQNPTINVIADVLPVPAEAYNPFNKYYGASFNVPLDINNHIQHKKNIAIGLLNSSKNLFLDNIRQLKLKIRTAYWTSLALRDKLELANQNLERLNSFVEVSKIRLKNFDIPEVDLTRAEFVRDQYINDLEAAKSSYYESLIDLQYLMGRKVINDTLELQSDIEEITAPEQLTLDDALSEAIAKRSDLNSLKNQLEADKANKLLQESYKHPDLSVQLDYTAQQMTYFWGLTFNLTLPIFNKNEGEISKSYVKVDQDNLAINGMLQSMRTEIKKAMEEMQISWTVVQSHKNNLIPKSVEILKTEEYSYKSGSTTLIDYFEAQRTFNETMNNYIDNLLRYHLNQSLFLSAISKDN